MEQIKGFFGKLFGGLWENKGALGGAAGGMMLASMLFPEGGILTTIIGLALGALAGGTLLDDGNGFVNSLLHRKQDGLGHGRSHANEYGQMQTLGKEGGMETHALESGISVVGRDQFKTLSTEGDGQFEKNGEFKVYKANITLKDGHTVEQQLDTPVMLKVDAVGNFVQNNGLKSLTEQLNTAKVGIEKQVTEHPQHVQHSAGKSASHQVSDAELAQMFAGKDIVPDKYGHATVVAPKTPALAQNEQGGHPDKPHFAGPHRNR